MKLPRHLTPKALTRALRKEKVDRVLGRPRLRVWKPWEQLLPKPQEPLLGTREDRRWELVVRACKRERRLPDGPKRELVSRVLDSLLLRRWVVWWFRLNPLLDRFQESETQENEDLEKKDTPTAGLAQESPAVASAFDPPTPVGSSLRSLLRENDEHPSFQYPANQPVDFGALFVQTAVFLLLALLFFVAWHFAFYVAVGMFIFGIIGSLCAGSTDNQDPKL